MENSELRKEFEAYSRRASKYTEQGEIKNAALFQKYADQVLLEMNGTAEKKNPSEAGYSSSESKSADGAEQQPLSPQKESFDSNDDSVVLESVSSSRNSLGGKKWIGLSHVSKFKRRLRNILVHGLHQGVDRFLADCVIATFESGESRTLDDRDVVAVKVVVAQ